MLLLSDIRNEIQEMVDDIGNFTVVIDSPMNKLNMEFDVMNIDIKPERNKAYIYNQRTSKWMSFKNDVMHFIYVIITDNYIDRKMRM
ncbi:MAG: hypothetical protein ACRCX2_07715 [Paraclostridium sp.]